MQPELMLQVRSLPWRGAAHLRRQSRVTLSPLLLLKRALRERFLFLSAPPVKVSGPVIASGARSAHRHRADLHAAFSGDTSKQFAALLSGSY